MPHPQDQDGFDDPAAARDPITSPNGKLHEDLKTAVDVQAHTDFLRAAANVGVVPGVLLREIVHAYLYGQTFAEQCAEHRTRQIRREGRIEDVMRMAGGAHS